MVLTVSRKNTEPTEYVVTAKGKYKLVKNVSIDDEFIRNGKLEQKYRS